MAAVKYDGGIRWRCSSKKARKCKAFVVVTENGRAIIRVAGVHNHEPPKYKLTPLGTYVKIHKSRKQR